MEGEVTAFLLQPKPGRGGPWGPWSYRADTYAPRTQRAHTHTHSVEGIQAERGLRPGGLFGSLGSAQWAPWPRASAGLVLEYDIMSRLIFFS